VLGPEGLVVIDLVVRRFQGEHLVVTELLLTVVYPVAGVPEQFGHADKVGGVLQFAVGIQEIEEWRSSESIRDTSCLIRMHPDLGATHRTPWHLAEAAARLADGRLTRGESGQMP
jgi:hypothetical protein